MTEQQKTKLSLEQLVSIYGNKSLVEREIQLEIESKSLAYNRYMTLLNKSREKGIPTGTLEAIISECMSPMINHLSVFLDEASKGKSGRYSTAIRLYGNLTPEELSLITLRTIFSSALKMKQGIPLVTLCRAIGDRIIDEQRAKAVIESVEFDAKKNAKSRATHRVRVMSYYHALEKHAINNKLLSPDDLPQVSNADKVRGGLKLIETFIESTALGHLLKVSHKSSFSYTFKIDDYISTYIYHNDEHLADLSYIKRPMLIKPLEWTTPYDGGYILKLASDEGLVKVNKHQLHFYEDIDMPNVYKAINALQSTPWRINKRILKVLSEIRTWQCPPEHLDFPSVVSLDEPPKCDDEVRADPKAFSEWKRRASLWYSADVQRQGRRLLVEMLYQQAKEYKNEDAIYFPYSLDFRGRCYPMTLLSPQGSDLNKSLIEFAEGVPLGSEGAKWLAFHGANLWGLDKKPFEERLSWTYKNGDMIQAIAKDPLNNLAWCDADSPWEFLAWCFEWDGYLKEGEAYVSHIPVAFDGSCSGLQHYSAMLKDPVGATAVNLVPDTKVHDIYGIVAEKVNEKLRVDARGESVDTVKVSRKTKQEYIQKSDASLANEWINFGMAKYGTRGISRKETKRSVMTLCYGSKQYGFAEQVYEDTVAPALFNNPLAFSRPKQASKYLAKLIWDSVQEVVVKAVEGMQWLQSASSLLASQKDALGQPLPTYWITPVGFPVKQEYHKTLLKQVELSFGEKVLYRIVDTTGTGDKENNRYTPLVAQDVPETLDPRKQRQGIAPNFVHSMDASHMMLTVCACLDCGITSFAMIHDSYGTHAGNAGILFKTVRDVFVDTYSKHNVLEDIRGHVMNMLPDSAIKDLPEVPQQGTLDLELVRTSLYAFA